MNDGSAVMIYGVFREIPVLGESIKPHWFAPAENLGFPV